MPLEQGAAQLSLSPLTVLAGHSQTGRQWIHSKVRSPAYS